MARFAGEPASASGLCAFAAAYPPVEGHGAAAQDERRFTLRITGAEGTGFGGECRLETARGEETIALDGPLPFVRELTGYGLVCRISQTSREGNLTVEVRKGDGAVSRSSTQGPGSTVNIALR